MPALTIKEQAITSLISGASSDGIALGIFSGAIALAVNSLIKSSIRALQARGIAMRDAHEIILQSYLFCGFPRMLDALFDLAELVTPAKFNADSMVNLQSLMYTNSESQEFERRGRELIRQVYAENYPKLESAVTAMSPEVFRLMIMEGYGKTLSRPGLSVQTRELAVVAALTVDGRARQLKAHIRGALNVGVPSAELHELLKALEQIADQELVSFARRMLNDMTGD